MIGPIRIVGLMLMLLAAAPVFSQPCDCVNTGNCPVPIQDNGSFFGTLDVTVSGPNDLGACPLTQVCFDITHTWVGDLAVTLTSPSGLNYIVMGDIDNGFGGCGNEEDNLEVCVTVGTGNALTNNTEYLCNSGPCSSGTCCLTGFWTVPCGGVNDPVTFAQQAPNCDLNDFNVPGDPANGTWTLTVNDICSQDIGTLNNFSLTFACGTSVCTVCEADGGELNAPDVVGCFGDPDLNLDLPPQYNNGPAPNPGEYDYAYVISQNDIIIAVNPTADMSFQPPGEYQLCGLSYLSLAQGSLTSLLGMNLTAAQNLMSSATAPFCGDFSDDCISVTIGPVIPPTVLDTAVCLGNCIMVGNQEVCNSGTVVLESWLGCDSVIEVIMVPIIIPPSTDQVTVCQGECVEINGQQYCPPGPHPITYESWQGCDSIVTWIIIEEITQAIINPFNPPPLDCTNTSTTLDGTSSFPPTGVYSWEGPNGFTSSDPVITITEPGDYILTIVNNALSPPCTNSTEVTVTGDIEGPDLQVNSSPPSICEGDTFDLNDLNIVDLNNTDPIISFHSGTPATAANELTSTLVAPAASTTYYILGTTGSCTDETSITLTVNPLPSADFSATSPICLDETSTITYNGSGGANATYNWNFGGGTADPGTGPGPHTITWTTGGTKTITLIVEENGCTSTSFSQTVTVDPPLPDPVINCIPSIDGIEFTWNAVPGASGYNVSVVIGPMGTMTSDTSYAVTGMNPGDQSSIVVEAIAGNSCGNTSTQITCTAQDCPPITITVDPVPDICLDGNAGTVQLAASQMGGDGSGAYTWSGPGVNPFSGVFDPDNANIGPNNIVVTYEEGTCLYNGSLTINVFPQPTSDFTVNTPICSDGSSTVNYIGNASSDAIFDWDFNGGTADPGTGPGPHTVTWSNGGTYTVSLTVEENGCTSEMSDEEVLVDEPLPAPSISCDANTSTVEFFWNGIAGASDFTVNVLAGSGGTMTSDTSMLFDGLNPGDVISIEVIANGTGPCGSSSAQANCTANDCPDIIIDIQQVADVCLDNNAVPFDLMATISGGVGGGSLSWSGDGITDPLAGTFDPSAAVNGENIVTALYEEGNCTFTQDISINVFELPEASFISDTLICIEDEAIITFDGTVAPGLIFNWDFGGGIAVPGTGQGPHDISFSDGGQQAVSLILEDANGCISEPFEVTIEVDEPLIAPMISCDATTSSIEFTWPLVTGATDYEVSVVSGPTGVFTPPDNYLVDGLNPDDEVTIELTVSGDGACPPVSIQQTCIAVDCPTVTIDITPVPSMCLSAADPVNLTATISGGMGTGTGTWSGPGVNIDVFDASAAGIGNHEITYTYQENNCSYSNTVLIEVFAEPTADFSATPVICISDAAEIIYTGNAASDATFTWDFGSGNATPGTGGGPQTITWNAPGTYTISLSVEQDGCASQVFTQDVQVDEEIPDPVINCSVTVESVEFTWNTIPGATDYEVSVISGSTGIFTPPNSYLVEGLVPGDEITIQLTTSGNSVCPPSIVQASCTANDCPDVMIDLTPVAPICLDVQATPVVLEAMVTGGSGNGIGSWSGDGITDPSAGIFDPSVAGIGNHSLVYTYEENANCIFTNGINVEIIAPPIADAGLDAVLTCKDGETDIELGGTGNSTGNNITYNWSAVSGPFPGDSTVLNPIVAIPGTYTLTVTNTDLGCSATDIVEVEASQNVPVLDVSLVPISCFGENDGAISVTSVTGGQAPYMFSLNGNPYSNNSTFTELGPGVYELNVLDANGCQNQVTFDIQQPQEVNVELVVYVEGENIVKLGEDVEMEAVSTIPEDSLELIQWEPSALVDCDSCLNVSTSLIQQTTFTITIEDNGCMDSDAVTVFVSKDRPVYVPNAFSPNEDGINDVFMIFANSDQVTNIKSFIVLSRWGETVFQYFNFQPNDPAYGWDGKHRNELLNPAVFTWFAEVEYIDGYTQVLEGDVTLMR